MLKQQKEKNRYTPTLNAMMLGASTVRWSSY